VKSRTTYKRPRVADFPPPKVISDQDLDEIFSNFDILDKGQRPATKDRLNKLVKEVTKWVNKPQPRLAADLKRMEEMRNAISSILKELDQLGFFGIQALKCVAGYLGPMLSAQWINGRFPDDDWAPTKTSAERHSHLHEPARSERYFVEEFTGEMRHQFVQKRTREVVKEILLELDTSIASALSRNVDEGGPGRLTDRHYFLINLTDLWASLGRTVSGGPRSELIRFCEYIFEIVGWPNDSLDDAVQKAIKQWREISV
jgi:hypothetical protein